MQIVYLYDLKAGNRKRFNRVKRLFYYHINRLPLKKEFWKTKSALAVDLRMEKPLDRFFRRFGKNVIVYKIRTDSIELIES